MISEICPWELTRSFSSLKAKLTGVIQMYVPDEHSNDAILILVP